MKALGYAILALIFSAATVVSILVSIGFFLDLWTMPDAYESTFWRVVHILQNILEPLILLALTAHFATKFCRLTFRMPDIPS